MTDVGMRLRRLRLPPSPPKKRKPQMLGRETLRGKQVIEMGHRALGYALAFLCSCTLAPVGAQSPPRAVIELFTSQGCSSCPPADKLLGELAEDPSLVTLSVPIDYWDYLGWKDTLANHHNTVRQKAYAHVRGDGQVYTPQAVVNGGVHVLGSDRAAIEHAIAKTRKAGAMSGPAPSLTFANGRIEIVAPQATDTGASAEAWLWALTKTATIAIARGENKGRTITYHNVARQRLKLGDWNGERSTWSVPAQTLAGQGADEVAVLLQSGTLEKPKIILGAAFSDIR
jgi:hypothetical protein